MTIVASNNITVSNVNDGTITHTAYAYSADGTDRFTTVYPNLNLLDGTKDFSGDWDRTDGWVNDGTYKGLTVKKRTGGKWNGICKTFTVPKDGSYTFSAYIKSSGNSANIIRYGGLNSTSNNATMSNSIGNNFDWTRDSVTLNLKANDSVWIRYEISGDGTDSILWNAGHKWEPGSTATPYMPSSSEVKTSDYPSYIGTYSDTNVDGSTDSSKYIWVVFKGADGIAGQPGANAPTITNVQDQIYLSTSNTAQSGGSWGILIPAWSSGKYYWSRVATTFSNGTTTYSTPVLDEALNQAATNQVKVTQLTQDLDGFKTTVSNTYLSKSDASGTYADKVSVASQITQSATAVTSNVQSWTDNKLTAYSTTQQTANSITNAVADKADKSKITQLSDSINLRVSKGDVVSQINVEAGRTLIDTKQLLLNADTVKFSGSAFIPNAMIQNLSAEKITAGTLNAANVNVINLNADSLTAGTITGIDIRSSTFYGSSTLGDMQLNSNNLIFYKSDNIFTIDYSGITNVNTKYGTRNINFYSEGIEIKSGNNTGVFKNSGLILDGSESYIDFRSDSGSARIWKTNTNKLLMITNSGGGIKIQAGNIDFSGSNLLNTANIVTTQDNINKVKSLLIGDAATNVVGSTGRYLILDTNKGVFGMGGMWQSDRKLKKNIKKAKGSALDILDKIGVKQFDWKEGGSHVEYGLIAQEVESALPQAVFEVEQDDGSFIKQIEATGIIPILIKSIHELKSELENIKNNINFKEK